MKINAVSFGKIVEVHAPFHDAVRIASAVNGAPCVKPEVQEQVQKIFDDTEKGHAVAFVFNDFPKGSHNYSREAKNSDVCYIFSGEESKKYLHHLYQKAVVVRDIKMRNPLSESLPKIVKMKEYFNEKIADMIEKKKEDYSLKISPNGESVEKVFV
ncbi:hypothetical protein IKQ26_00915 [bacterium]|nr:hypothetical protein [bacterium]